MDYEKIILELLGRIQTLEEKVESLSQKKESVQKADGIRTQDIKEYIEEQKGNAKALGRDRVVLIARDIHRELDLKSKFPMVCNAMRQCMAEGDVILFQPPKGNSSTLKIEYRL